MPVYNGCLYPAFNDKYKSLPTYHGEILTNSYVIVIHTVGIQSTPERTRSIEYMENADSTLHLNIIAVIVLAGPDPNAFLVGSAVGVPFDVSLHRYRFLQDGDTNDDTEELGDEYDDIDF